jgi:hypothetical protein
MLLRWKASAMGMFVSSALVATAQPCVLMACKQLLQQIYSLDRRHVHPASFKA